jgi:hypothetical protein
MRFTWRSKLASPVKNIVIPTTQEEGICSNQLPTKFEQIAVSLFLLRAMTAFIVLAQAILYCYFT